MRSRTAAHAGAAADGPALSQRLRHATADWHRRAERAGVMPALLQGRLPIEGYLALLAQLEAVYAALEAGLDRPGAPPLDPALRRLGALRQDLAVLRARAAGRAERSAPAADDGGAGSVAPPAAHAPLLAPTLRYVERLRAQATTQPWRLAAPAYVRYLGDLAGGQVLRRIVGRAYGLAADGGPDGGAQVDGATDAAAPPEGLRFYDFGPPARAASLARALRDTLDALPAAQADALVDEACLGFAAHVDIFEALAQAAPRPLPSRITRRTP